MPADLWVKGSWGAKPRQLNRLTCGFLGRRYFASKIRFHDNSQQLGDVGTEKPGARERHHDRAVPARLTSTPAG